MDMNKWHADTVKRLLQGHENKPWLVCCGWPCQDNSPGGRGLSAEGHRPTMIDTIIPLIRTSQSRTQCAYFLENTAIQHNWTDQSNAQHCCIHTIHTTEGWGRTYAVRFGSSTHRARNYWTNIADVTTLQRALNNVEVPLPPLHQHFPPGTKFAHVERSDSAYFFPANRTNQPICVLPTFTSCVASRACTLVPSKLQEGQSKP